MPDLISKTAQGEAGSAATALEGAVWDALGLRDAVEGARIEAERSGLPGVNDGGPGDAYRHLLIAGEMKRRFGPAFANRFAKAHEFINDLTRSQTERDNKMDRHNNALAVDGPEFRTWEELGGAGPMGARQGDRGSPSQWRRPGGTCLLVPETAG